MHPALVCLRPCFVETTATCEGLALLKERLHSLYVEQLCERPKPIGRSGTLGTIFLAPIGQANRLESLDTIESLWLFGEKCLKKSHLREVFREFGFQDVFASATSQQVQTASVFPVEECERDIAFQDRAATVFEQALIPGRAEVDLTAPSFEQPLQPSGKTFDLE